MKKPHWSALITITAVFTAFTLGFFLGKSQNSGEIRVSVPVCMETPETTLSTSPAATESTVPTTGEAAVEKAVTFPVNINTATKEELMALPGIGEVLAGRIIAYRTDHQGFSSPGELTRVNGIGQKRMEQIVDLITIGGES